ncbi:hypothetical protein [Nocardioides convexus]|uniref:non-homologous end-joining DNA ligase LigD n=1 Tax=Nocardioides convexus TaxID=2712224 RepID=UPI0031018AF5
MRDDQVTTAWWKEERGERIFIDYNQNNRDRTIASAYSLRPLPGAPVSTPMTWAEPGRGHRPEGVQPLHRPRSRRRRRPVGGHRRGGVLAAAAAGPVGRPGSPRGRGSSTSRRTTPRCRGSRRGCSRARRSPSTGTTRATGSSRAQRPFTTATSQSRARSLRTRGSRPGTPSASSRCAPQRAAWPGCPRSRSGTIATMLSHRSIARSRSAGDRRVPASASKRRTSRVCRADMTAQRPGAPGCYGSDAGDALAAAGRLLLERLVLEQVQDGDAELCGAPARSSRRGRTPPPGAAGSR